MSHLLLKFPEGRPKCNVTLAVKVRRRTSSMRCHTCYKRLRKDVLNATSHLLLKFAEGRLKCNVTLAIKVCGRTSKMQCPTCY